MRLAQRFFCALICGFGCNVGATLFAQQPGLAPSGPGPYSASPQMMNGEYCPPYAGASGASPYTLPSVPDNGPWSTADGIPAGGAAVRDPYFVRNYFRAEYLSVTIQEPGTVLLGGEILGVNNFAPFQAFSEEGDLIGNVQIPNTSSINFKDINGVRTTFGWESLDGSLIEFNAFVTENAIKRIGAETLNPGEIFATSVLINGQPSDGFNAAGIETPNLFFYNQRYYARYASRVWGSELNYFADPYTWAMFELRPMIGVRYVNFYESIQQRGLFLSDSTGDLVNTHIDSGAYNSVITSQFGFRLELPTKYLTFGVEPKFGIGPRFAKAEVTTVNLRDISDGTVSTDDHTLGYSSVMDLNGYVRFNVSDNFTLSLGFMMTYLGSVVRGSTSTYYNDSGDLSVPPAVIASAQKTDVYWRGFTIGGEFRW